MMTGVIFIAVLASVVLLGYFLAPKGWRTVVMNATAGFMVTLPSLLEYLSGADWGSMLPQEYAVGVAVAMNALAIIMRSVTTTPIGGSK